MTDSLYQEVILEHYRNPRNFGSIARATHTARMYNPLCGDDVVLTVIIKKNTLSEVAFFGEGCAISRASASLLTEYIKGKKISDLRKVNQSVILSLLGIELSPIRMQCALLPLKALHKII
ncbi:MAG TPA: SUF system NifU family Fe-S cluster assembly protein [Patescibacteria group bacterium]|nr:SUF system NifU family Fe-S cluster assembly protein [Patescibacteria group bacterium]